MYSLSSVSSAVEQGFYTAKAGSSNLSPSTISCGRRRGVGLQLDSKSRPTYGLRVRLLRLPPMPIRLTGRTPDSESGRLRFKSSVGNQYGGMAERSIAPSWKGGGPQGSAGSNPAPSAITRPKNVYRFRTAFFEDMWTQGLGTRLSSEGMRIQVSSYPPVPRCRPLRAVLRKACSRHE